MTRSRHPFLRSRLAPILALGLLASARPARALDELFEVYNAPQSLGMGKAFAADATGYAALFHNPAGLAKGESRKWEVTPVAFELVPGFGGMGAALSTRSVGTYQLGRNTAANPGSYRYFRGNFVPAVSYHQFALALLGSYEYAGLSDGTNTDVRATTDLGVVAGGAFNVFDNLMKVGFAVKAIDRNQLQGVFDNGIFNAGNDALKPLMKEGIGLGGDLGLMFTAPNKWLPTFAVTWKDVLNTKFYATHLQNSLASGLPDAIPQSLNLAGSLHPYLSRGVRATFAAEYRHLDKPQIAWRKKLHLGMQLLTDKSFYFWLGLSQLYPTGGIAYRVRGGNLELGTYAEDIGAGDTALADRRFFLRYTIGF